MIGVGRESNTIFSLITPTTTSLVAVVLAAGSVRNDCGLIASLISLEEAKPLLAGAGRSGSLRVTSRGLASFLRAPLSKLLPMRNVGVWMRVAGNPRR